MNTCRCRPDSEIALNIKNLIRHGTPFTWALVRLSFARHGTVLLSLGPR